MVKNEDTWETQEVIRHCINDEDTFNELLTIVANAEDEEEAENAVYQYVVREQAGPQELYKSMNRPPALDWNDVDWASVVESLREE